MNLPIAPGHKREVERAISRAIDFLGQSQREYGEFATYAWGDEAHIEISRFDSSLFVTALVLYSIGYADHERVAAITVKGLEFLSGEMEGTGLWRFWSSRNPLRKFLPPDLDDTCCISFILHRHGRKVPDNGKLILGNTNGEGLFYTWMAVRPDSPADVVCELERVMHSSSNAILEFLGLLDNVDCVVNANVLLYLGERAETQGTLNYLINAVLDGQGASCSRLYLDRLAFYYALSRAYANGVSSLARTRDTVVEQVLAAREEHGAWRNELLTALAGCTLLNFGYGEGSLQRGIDYLLQSQRGDGAWRRIAMFPGPEPYYGSEELTTGLCVELLARYG